MAKIILKPIGAFIYFVLKSVSFKFFFGKKISYPVEYLRTQALVWQGARIGKGTFVRDHVFVAFPENLHLGKDITVGPFSRFFNYAEVRVGDSTELGPGLHIQTNEHLWPDSSKPLGKQGAYKEPVVIGSGVYIGANVTVLKGVKISDRCLIAAGAVVVKNCETGNIYGGVPAKPISKIH